MIPRITQRHTQCMAKGAVTADAGCDAGIGEGRKESNDQNLWMVLGGVR